jgi:hypothetical protein
MSRCPALQVCRAKGTTCSQDASRGDAVGAKWERSWNREVSHHGNEIEIVAESSRTPIHFVFRCHRLT